MGSKQAGGIPPEWSASAEPAEDVDTNEAGEAIADRGEVVDASEGEGNSALTLVVGGGRVSGMGALENMYFSKRPTNALVPESAGVQDGLRLSIVRGAKSLAATTERQARTFSFVLRQGVTSFLHLSTIDDSERRDSIGGSAAS